MILLLQRNGKSVMMYAESCRAKRKVQNADLEFIEHLTETL